MKIRKAAEKDLPEFVSMWADFMKYHEKMDSYFTMNEHAIKNYEEYIRISLTSENSLVLVALDNNEHIIGRAFCQIDVYPPIFLKERYVHFWELDVKEAYRSQGVGSALYQKVLQWCSDKKIKRIELEIQPKNPLGLRFWDKYEFKNFLHRMYLDL